MHKLRWKYAYRKSEEEEMVTKTLTNNWKWCENNILFVSSALNVNLLKTKYKKIQVRNYEFHLNND